MKINASEGIVKVCQIEDDIVNVCAELHEEFGHYFSWRQARLLSYGAKMSSVLDMPSVPQEKDIPSVTCPQCGTLILGT